MSKASARGFTLIELVVVITILGILSAFAVPKFLALDGKAREAAVEGLAGSLRSAAALAHSMYLVNNGVVVIEGQTIAMVNRYPARTATGIIATMQDLSGFDTATAGQFRKIGATTPANCRVNYVQATATAPPQITTVVTGC